MEQRKGRPGQRPAHRGQAQAAGITEPVNTWAGWKDTPVHGEPGAKALVQAVLKVTQLTKGRRPGPIGHQFFQCIGGYLQLRWRRGKGRNGENGSRKNWNQIRQTPF